MRSALLRAPGAARFTGRRLGKRKRKGFEQTGMDGAVWTAARRRSRRSMTVPAGGKRAWFARPRAAFLWAISVAPSPQRPPKSSILAGAASFDHGMGMRLGSGARRCRLAQHGGRSWATSSTIFCCSPVWHYSSRGLSSRPRACSSDAAPLLSDAPRAVCAST